VRDKQKRVPFNWLNVPDAAGYHLQIARGESMEPILVDRDGITGSAYTADLPDFGPYHYRIRSVAEDGYHGPWSDVLRFQIVPPPPAPELKAPSTDKEGMMSLRWRDQGPGFSYRIQVAADEEFEDVLVDRRVEEPRAAFEKPGWGTWFVRIRAVDPYGYAGEFSPPQTFEVGPGWLLGIPAGLGTAVILLGILL
jgi:hypothetical protein